MLKEDWIEELLEIDVLSDFQEDLLCILFGWDFDQSSLGVDWLVLRWYVGHVSHGYVDGEILSREQGLDSIGDPLLSDSILKSLEVDLVQRSLLLSFNLAFDSLLLC